METIIMNEKYKYLSMFSFITNSNPRLANKIRAFLNTFPEDLVNDFNELYRSGDIENGDFNGYEDEDETFGKIKFSIFIDEETLCFEQETETSYDFLHINPLDRDHLKDGENHLLDFYCLGEGIAFNIKKDGDKCTVYSYTFELKKDGDAPAKN